MSREQQESALAPIDVVFMEEVAVPEGFDHLTVDELYEWGSEVIGPDALARALEEVAHYGDATITDLLHGWSIVVEAVEDGRVAIRRATAVAALTATLATSSGLAIAELSNPNPAYAYEQQQQTELGVDGRSTTANEQLQHFAQDHPNVHVIDVTDQADNTARSDNIHPADYRSYAQSVGRGIPDGQGRKIYVVGDSITEGMYTTGNLVGELEQRGWQVLGVNAQVSRSITRSGTTPKGEPLASGMTVLSDPNNPKIEQAQAFLIALGTNDAAEQTYDLYKQMHAAIHERNRDPNVAIFPVNQATTKGTRMPKVLLPPAPTTAPAPAPVTEWVAYDQETTPNDWTIPTTAVEPTTTTTAVANEAEWTVVDYDNQQADEYLVTQAEVAAHPPEGFASEADRERAIAYAVAVEQNAKKEQEAIASMAKLYEAQQAETRQYADNLPEESLHFAEVTYTQIVSSGLDQVYQQVEEATGVSRFDVAALHYREANNHPLKSILAGEPLGSVNPDTGKVEPAELVANGIRAAEIFKANALAYYGVQVRPDMSVDERLAAYTAYNRGNMYNNAQAHIGRVLSPRESPYAYNGIEGLGMRFPNMGHLGGNDNWGEPGSTQGRVDARPGAMAMYLGLIRLASHGGPVLVPPTAPAPMPASAEQTAEWVSYTGSHADTTPTEWVSYEYEQPTTAQPTEVIDTRSWEPYTEASDPGEWKTYTETTGPNTTTSTTTPNSSSTTNPTTTSTAPGSTVPAAAQNEWVAYDSHEDDTSDWVSSDGTRTTTTARSGQNNTVGHGTGTQVPTTTTTTTPELPPPPPEQPGLIGKSITRMPLDINMDNITSTFGVRDDPFKPGERSNHAGLDIGAPKGTPVHATVKGRVIAANTDAHCGNGVSVDAGVDSEGRPILVTYCHLSKMRVTVDQEVDEETIVGEVGSTGDSTGMHLHYQVKVDGKPVDPAPYLFEGKKF